MLLFVFVWHQNYFYSLWNLFLAIGCWSTSDRDQSGFLFLLFLWLLKITQRWPFLLFLSHKFSQFASSVFFLIRTLASCPKGSQCTFCVMAMWCLALVVLDTVCPTDIRWGGEWFWQGSRRGWGVCRQGGRVPVITWHSAAGHLGPSCPRPAGQQHAPTQTPHQAQQGKTVCLVVLICSVALTLCV